MEPHKYRNYYLREEILNSFYENSRDKEMVPVFYSRKYGKRPSYAEFPGDIRFWIKQGASSFHCSVENWKNPINIVNSKHAMDENRTSFDLLFDIDADKGIEFAKVAAILLIEELKQHKIKNIYAKFSGNRGFHVAVSHKTMPKYIGQKETKYMFPILLQQTASYLRIRIKKKLAEQYSKLLNKNIIDPYQYVDIEENWSNRHLFRMPYSLNEKTYLASVVLDINKIKYFKKKDADIEQIKKVKDFLKKGDENESQTLLVRANDYFSFEEEKTFNEVKKEKSIGFENKIKSKTKENLQNKIKNIPLSQRMAYREALSGDGALLFDFKPHKKKAGTKKGKTESTLTNKEKSIYELFVDDIGEKEVILSDKKTSLLFVPEIISNRIRSLKYSKNIKSISFKYFPPCIKTILAGIDDGKKRAVFILINFLTSCGWQKENIKELLLEWNTKNKEPLKEHYITSQISYAKEGSDAVFPPNCKKSGYYGDIEVCHRDEFCIEINITNPVFYALTKDKFKVKKK